MTDKLLFDITDKIATITFNNPEKLNAFTMEMLVAYRERLEECRTREDVWAIIVTGAGRGFCSGGDTGRMGADTPPTPAEIKSGLWDLVQLISLKMTEIDKPIIAAVNGVAVGAGMDMSLHADLRIAAKAPVLPKHMCALVLYPGTAEPGSCLDLLECRERWRCCGARTSSTRKKPWNTAWSTKLSQTTS